MGGDGGCPLHHGSHRQECRPVSLLVLLTLVQIICICTALNHIRRHLKALFSEEKEMNSFIAQGATVAREKSSH